MDRMIGTMDASPSMGGGGGLSSMSPYLNFDPSILQQQGPEYILMEGVDKNKGVSHYCYQVGIPVLAGASIGSIEGSVYGWKAALQATGKEGRAMFLNAVRDQVKHRCHPLGAMATIFGFSQFGMSQIRDTQDEVTYMTSGAFTGLLYKSTSGWKKAARGGAVGLVAGGTLYLLYSLVAGNKKDFFYRIRNQLTK